MWEAAGATEQSRRAVLEMNQQEFRGNWKTVKSRTEFPQSIFDKLIISFLGDPCRIRFLSSGLSTSVNKCLMNSI